jgi:L,D-transpeptidase ErfK/SrfK
MSRILAILAIVFVTNSAFCHQYEHEHGVFNSTYHIVRKAETLHDIAKYYHLSFNDLMTANPEIRSLRQIYTGQKINLPTGAYHHIHEKNYAYNYHIVKRGETLQIIAKNYGLSLKELIFANKKINLSRRLRVGQKIYIPDTADYNYSYEYEGEDEYYNFEPEEVEVTYVNYEADYDDDIYVRYHVVRRGETLNLIAGYYGVTLRDILDANRNIKNVRKIYPGQRIFIPLHYYENGEDTKLLYYSKTTKTETYEVDSYEYENSQNKYHVIKKDETLHDIARYYDLGITELLRANPHIKEWQKLKHGQKVILPTFTLVPDAEHEGIVINVAEPRLYYFDDNDDVMTFPVTIGKKRKTPLGTTYITSKKKDPSWAPTPSIRLENPDLPSIVRPGPANPLGEYAFYLDGSSHSKWSRIRIHGTNSLKSIGLKVSHGCVRLYPKDIKTLFSKVGIGTKVTIVNQPIKVAEIKGRIYLETHLDKPAKFTSPKTEIGRQICSKINDCKNRVDWRKVNYVAKRNLGIPVDITIGSERLIGELEFDDTNMVSQDDFDVSYMGF